MEILLYFPFGVAHWHSPGNSSRVSSVKITEKYIKILFVVCSTSMWFVVFIAFANYMRPASLNFNGKCQLNEQMDDFVFLSQKNTRRRKFENEFPYKLLDIVFTSWLNNFV